MTERGMDIDEAIKAVIEIGKRFELQGRLAEEAARVERHRKQKKENAARPQAAGLWR